MTTDRDTYDKDIVTRIANENKWPNIDNANLIIELLRIAKKQSETQTVEGCLSSILIYQQVIEEYLINLIKLSNLYVQAEIWPTQLLLKIKNKLTLGKLIEECKKTVEFDKKVELLDKCQAFNETRVKFVHHLLKFKNYKEILAEAKEIKFVFYYIFDLYWDSRTYLEWKLSDLKNRVDWNEMIE